MTRLIIKALPLIHGHSTSTMTSDKLFRTWDKNIPTKETQI